MTKHNSGDLIKWDACKVVCVAQRPSSINKVTFCCFATQSLKRDSLAFN